MNPWGDLIAMARAWCVVKPGKRALIGIPIGPGDDRIYFNSHKVYGPLMLSHLFANWKQIFAELDKDGEIFSYWSEECTSCLQIVFILEK